MPTWCLEKKAEMNEEEESQMISRGSQRKIILISIEVWVDVLGFIRRIQLARTISLTNWHLLQMCWPRLHGDKVRAHEVELIIIGHRHEFGQPATALLQQKGKELPFPECPPPDYITGFALILINFLDHQALAFLSLIAPRIATNKVGIIFTMKLSHMDENQIASLNRLLQLFKEKITTKTVGIIFTMKLSHMDENQRASVNQRLQLFKEKIPTIPSIFFDRCLSSIQFLPDVDNKMKRMVCFRVKESDIPILTEFLASPRADGQQRVMILSFCVEELPVVLKLVDAIKEEFPSSIQPVPQPFYICVRLQHPHILNFRPHNFNIPQSEEGNPQTDETLAIVPNTRDGNFVICRHPRGQHEQWAEDARKRMPSANNSSTTQILMDI